MNNTLQTRSASAWSPRPNIQTGRLLLPSVAVLAALLCVPCADLNAVTAVPANDFLNSLGVCTHMGQGVDQPADVATALNYTGQRNIRDDGITDVSRFITVHNNTTQGVKVSLIAIEDNLAGSIASWKSLANAGALLACEGANEPNNQAVTYNGATTDMNTTFLPVAQFQRDIYAAVKADPVLNSYPVFHSSSSSGPSPDNLGMQFLTIPTPAPSGVLMPAGTQYADYANCHNYVKATQHTAILDNHAWKASSPDVIQGLYDGIWGQYGSTWRNHFSGYTAAQLTNLPKVTTETGWYTQGANPITEDQQGKLFLNVYLSAFKRSWKHTFIYMLRDDPSQGYWGLFRTNWTAKPSATFIRNLTTILADTVSIAPDSLDYSIPSQPATVHDLLIQKSDGSFRLAVWNERASGSDAVTVNLGAYYTGVKIYDPTVGTSPTQTLSGSVNSVVLTLSDHPNLIEIPAVSENSESNIALGKAVSASSFQTGNEVAKGNDNSLTTRWGAGAGTYPQWWQVDLGSNQPFSRMDIAWYSSSNRGYKYRIEASTDNVNFTTLVDKTGNTAFGDTTDSFATTTQRYVRVTVTGCTASVGWASANEFKLIGPPPNLAIGKTATASSFQTGNEVAKGNDNNTATRWGAGAGTYPQWWQVDLGSSQAVSRMNIAWYNSASRGYKYRIEVSTDGVNFTTVVDKTGNTTYGDTADIFAATSQRYVRVTVTGCTAALGWASANEFKVY